MQSPSPRILLQGECTVHMEHAFSIVAPAERVWLALTSPRWLMFTIPGATLTRENRGGFEGTLVVQVGSTAATCTGSAVWTERDEAAHRLVIRAHATDLRLDNGEEVEDRSAATFTAAVAAVGRETSTVTLSIDLMPSRLHHGQIEEHAIGRAVDALLQHFAAGMAEGLTTHGPGLAYMPPNVTALQEPTSSVREDAANAAIAQLVVSKKRNGIFISYRRSDSEATAGRLYDKFETKFGKEEVFMDVDSIDLGLDFVQVLGLALTHCRALIVVIGCGWLDAKDDDGTRRIDHEDDFVRLEIEAALRRDIRVIPLLIDGARMPRAKDLPDSMKALSRRNGRAIWNARFNSDCLELISTLERILAD